MKKDIQSGREIMENNFTENIQVLQSISILKKTWHKKFPKKKKSERC